MAKRRLLFGWFDAGKASFWISQYPPDAPVRPSLEFEMKDDLEAFLKRKKADVYWWPPLPDKVSAPS